VGASSDFEKASSLSDDGQLVDFAKIFSGSESRLIIPFTAQPDLTHCE
jgi:hypothetical protein